MADRRSSTNRKPTPLREYVEYAVAFTAEDALLTVDNIQYSMSDLVKIHSDWDGLTEDITQHGSKAVIWGIRSAVASREAVDAETQLKYLAALLDRSIRQGWDVVVDGKQTEDAIKSTVLTQREYREQMVRCQMLAEKAVTLKVVYEQLSSNLLLNTLAKMFLDERFEGRSKPE